MPKPGNWSRTPWNRGTTRTPVPVVGLSPVMSKLVALRVAEHCTQEKLSEKTGWAQSAIAAYERGQKKVPLAYVEAALQALGKKLTIRDEK